MLFRSLAGDEPRILHSPDRLSDEAELGLGHDYRFVDGRREALTGDAIYAPERRGWQTRTPALANIQPPSGLGAKRRACSFIFYKMNFLKKIQARRNAGSRSHASPEGGQQ